MKRKTVIIKGPHFELTKRNSQKFLIEIAKRYVEQGKYSESIS